MIILLPGTAEGSHTGHSFPVFSQYPGSAIVVPAGVVMPGVVAGLRDVGVSFGFGVVASGDCFNELVVGRFVNSVPSFTEVTDCVVSFAKLDIEFVDCFDDKDEVGF